MPFPTSDRTPRRILTALVSTAAALPLLAGCGDDGGGGRAGSAPPPDPPTAVPVTTPAAAPTSDLPPFPPGTRRQEGAASEGARLVLTDVRAAARDGYDRLVLEFSGRGTPGWVVDYRRRAVLEGSGEVLDLEGDRELQVVTSNNEWPAPDYYDGPQRIDPRGDGPVDEVYVAGTFEGYTQVFAGLDGDRAPFRVFTLAAPTRLVVDVAD